MDLRDKKVLIIGMGKSGEAARDYLAGLGAEVYPFDDQKEGCFRRETLPKEVWDLVILSPGVPPDIPVVLDAAREGAEIIGELELAYRAGKGIFIGITGTNGKTTTTTLVGKIMGDAGLDCRVAGNIGSPVVTEVSTAGENTCIVTEVSSFQLETAETFKPRISALLNLTPDHLDRHGDMEGYGFAKARIFANQDEEDTFVYNLDDPLVAALAEQSVASPFPFSRIKRTEAGVCVDAGRILIVDGGRVVDLMGTDQLRIPGAHNLENALAAAAIAWRFGIPAETIADSLRNFSGVQHRLEPVAELSGVRYINDSKGTNPDASIKALEAIERDILLIAGGYDKQADYGEWIGAFRGRVRHLLLMGATAGNIRDAAVAAGFTEIHLCGDMAACVTKAAELAVSGDTVLLSPACASWDMYKRFEDRGDDFKDCVKALVSEYG